MSDLNLWQPGEEIAENYLQFKHIHEVLSELFSSDLGQPVDLYFVEHVFWFKGGNPYGGNKPTEETESTKKKTETSSKETLGEIQRLPDSYVPPIVSIIPHLSRNDVNLIEAAKASATSIERAFEKHLNAAFTILGYDTQLLGQGQGRVPDGRALDLDNSYAILWDAKVRSGGYSLGTDDRAIREYVLTQSRELKRRRALRNIYYCIISSSFKDDYDDAIRSLKMDTDVNEVCLIESAAIVEMVDAKLRDPQQLTLGPDGLQRLFSVSGILSASLVQSMLS